MHGPINIKFLRAYYFLVGQEFPSLLWTKNIHYSVHMGPPMVPVLSQVNAVQIFSSLRPILILLFHLCLVPPNCLSLIFPNQCNSFKIPIFCFCNTSHNSGSAKNVFSLSFGGNIEKAFAARRAKFGAEINHVDSSSVFVKCYF